MQFNSMQCNSIQLNSIQLNSIQLNSIQLNSIQFNSIQFSLTQFNSVQFSSIQFRPVQFHSIQFNIEGKSQPVLSQYTGLLVYSNLWMILPSRPSNELFHQPVNYKGITILGIRFACISCSYVGQTSDMLSGCGKNNLCIKGMHKFEYVSRPVYLDERSN